MATPITTAWITAMIAVPPTQPANTEKARWPAPLTAGRARLGSSRTTQPHCLSPSVRKKSVKNKVSTKPTINSAIDRPADSATDSRLEECASTHV